MTDRMAGTRFDFSHALAVARQFSFGTPAWIVALLHDAVEDGLVSLNDLREAEFPEDIVGSISYLTRGENETYTDYITRIANSGDDIARRVKIADISANLDRMDEEHASLGKRYELALDRLAKRR